MRNVSLSIEKIVKSIVVVAALFFTISSSHAQNANEGATLFRANCSSCHRVFGNLTGPELAGMSERRDQEWLLSWIKNAPSMIASGDPIALELDAAYPTAMMTAFPMLSDDDVLNIIAYVKSEEEKKAAGDAGGAAGGAATGGASASGDASNFMLFGVLVVIGLVLVIIYVLNRVIRTLERVVE